MNKTLTKLVRTIITIIFLFFVIQGITILHLSQNAQSVESLKSDIQNTVFLTFFGGFIFYVLLFLSFPKFLRNSFFEIKHIINEVARGNYYVDPSKINSKSSDKEIRRLVDDMGIMLKSIQKFNNRKQQKILEFKQRLLAMMRLSDDGFIITGIKGEIIYINDNVHFLFNDLVENINILNEHFCPEIENGIKKYIVEVLRSKTKKEDRQFYFPAIKRHLTFRSAIIRDTNGVPLGGIFVILNIDKKKADKVKDKEISDI